MCLTDTDVKILVDIVTADYESFVELSSKVLDMIEFEVKAKTGARCAGKISSQ